MVNGGYFDYAQYKWWMVDGGYFDYAQYKW
jgi:hypothetical protein